MLQLITLFIILPSCVITSCESLSQSAASHWKAVHCSMHEGGPTDQHPLTREDQRWCSRKKELKLRFCFLFFFVGVGVGARDLVCPNLYLSLNFEAKKNCAFKKGDFG